MKSKCRNILCNIWNSDKLCDIIRSKFVDFNNRKEIRGLFDIDTNAVRITGYYGLLGYDGSKFLIAGGRIIGDLTGLVAYDGAWFFLVYGELASNYICRNPERNVV